MMAQLKLSERGYGDQPKPTGEIEVWDGDKMEWRLATQDEVVPALIEIVIDLWNWRQRIINR